MRQHHRVLTQLFAMYDSVKQFCDDLENYRIKAINRVDFERSYNLFLSKIIHTVVVLEFEDIKVQNLKKELLSVDLAKKSDQSIHQQISDSIEKLKKISEERLVS